MPSFPAAVGKVSAAHGACAGSRGGAHCVPKGTPAGQCPAEFRRQAAGTCAPGCVYSAFPGSRGPCLHIGETPFLRGSIKTQKAPLTGELQILLERISQAAACCRSFFQNALSSMKPMPSSR